MSSTDPNGPAPASSSGVRPLPPKPSLEYERKQAKRLVAALRRGDPAAVTRAAQHDVASSRAEGGYQLANAQFVIAREYGFRSWPRLVEYFTILERHERSEREPISGSTEQLERQAEALVTQHRGRSARVASMLVSYVPRFFRMSGEEALRAEMTIDDAKLLLARQHLCASWDALLELSAGSPKTGGWEHYEKPGIQANRAIRTGDLATLSSLVEEHPELLERPEGDPGWHWPLIRHALSVELSAVIGGPQRASHPLPTTPSDARRVTDWLTSRGADAQGALNRMLLGYAHRMEHMEPADVEFLLARGADPEWMPPNGITVLEHALYRYGNGPSVDVLASRVTPMRSFWIAAGLGDCRGLERYIDRTGQLTEAARRSRPDLRAMGRAAFGMAPSQSRDDDHAILWEAFHIAALNERFAVLDRILETGFPVDYDADGWTLLHYAVGRRLVPLAEYLVSRGARPDRATTDSQYTARQGAAMMFLNSPSLPAVRRLFEFFGGDAETTLRRAEQERTITEAPIAPRLEETLKRATGEAKRLGQSAVEPHNIFLAILRDDRPELPLTFLSVAGVNISRLRRLIERRLLPDAVADAANGADSELPLSVEARVALESARAETKERRRTSVDSLRVMWALAGSETGAIADMLRAAGSTPARLREALATV